MADEPEEQPDAADALAAAQQRIEELQTRIETGLSGEREWTQIQISTFHQELTDLKATLTLLSETLPNLTELRAQLTPMRQELQELKTQVATISPPALQKSQEPPAPPENGNTRKEPNLNNRASGKRLL